MHRWLLALALVSGAFTSFAQGVSDWSKVTGLEKRLEQQVPAGQNAVDFYADKRHALHDAATEFLARNPTDPNAGTALLWKIDNTDFSGSAQQRTAVLAALSSETSSFLKVHPQPIATDSKIREELLYCYLDNGDLIDTPEQAGGLAEKIGQFLAAYPTTENRVKLQIARAGLLLRQDHAKGTAFLEQLSRDTDTELAAAAKAALSKANLVGNRLDLQFVDSEGKQIDLKQFQGKVVLIDFWASWCPDCLRELPQVQQVYRDYSTKGFAVIGISLDKDRSAMDNFIAKKLIPWPQYFDGKGWKNDLVTKYSVHEIPELWLINKQGVVETTSADITQLASAVQRLAAE
ncbi:MAG: TlpA family protein disulfide reductase [Verrucomicrobia bacterium]|nr:TlpA family protein disulfide reductase [Verrucomicrobiota bacterium]